MPANEIENRYAAGFTLELVGGGGEAPANWLPGILRYLSYCSVETEFIISSDPLRNPLIIVPLDRVLERSRTVVHWNMWVTTDLGTRFSTPVAIANQGVPADWTWEQARIGIQPMLRAWMGPGPDYSSPNWLPFNLGYGGAAQLLPPTEDENQYDAIACLFPNLFDVTPEPTTTWSNHLSVSIFELPENEIGNNISVNNTLPFFPVP